MSVESRHPDYQLHVQDWEACRDVYDGQSSVRRRDGGQRYLQPTRGMHIDGMRNGELGWKNYQAYLSRALLSGFFTDAVDTFMGMLWHRPTTFELGMLESYFGDDKPATSEGESLRQLLRRMHVEALVAARMLLMGELPGEETTTVAPYLCLYRAEKATNWDDGEFELGRRVLNLVVLDESGFVRNSALDWEWKKRFRVLQLGKLEENEETGKYLQARVDEGSDSIAFEAPTLRTRPLDQIPALFVGCKSTTTEIDTPPLLALANAVLALFRMDADYRQQIHMQGQDTLFTKGVPRENITGVGAGAIIWSDNPQADAKFIGVSAAGLAETRQAIENDRALCAKKAGEMLADNSKQRESGDALAERTGRKGASLLDIAQTCAAGLQQMLRIMAKWLGASPAQIEEIKVIPNVEFGTPKFEAEDLKKLVEVFVLNGPITLESIYKWSVAHGFPLPPTWEEFIAVKRSERELLEDLMPMPAPTPGDEDPADEETDAAAE